MSVSLIQYKLNLSNVLQNNLIPWLRCNVKLAAGHTKARFNSVIIVLVHLLCLNFLCSDRRLPWNASLTPLRFYLRIAGVANGKNTIQTSSWCNTWIINYSILHQTSPPEYSWKWKMLGHLCGFISRLKCATAIYQITVRYWSIEMLVKVEVLLSAWKQSAYVIVPAPKRVPREDI